jgi:carbon-monoxide dehydrogenase medium subunit
MSTIGGNIADGSPIADMAPPLLVLQAEVIAVSSRGERRIAADDFFDLPGKTTLEADQVIRSIRIPVPKHGCGKFIKLGLRKGTSCAVTSAAVWVESNNGSIENIRIALGGVAPRPIRAPHAEEAFTGTSFTNREAIAEASRNAVSDMNPISDVRGTAEYRSEVTVNLITKAVAACLGM